MKLNVGQWVRVMYDDVGARDGVLVDKVDKDEFRVFFPFGSTDLVERSQIVGIGPMLTAKDAQIK